MSRILREGKMGMGREDRGHLTGDRPGINEYHLLQKMNRKMLNSIKHKSMEEIFLLSAI